MKNEIIAQLTACQNNFIYYKEPGLSKKLRIWWENIDCLEQVDSSVLKKTALVLFSDKIHQYFCLINQYVGLSNSLYLEMSQVKEQLLFKKTFHDVKVKSLVAWLLKKPIPYFQDIMSNLHIENSSDFENFFNVLETTQILLDEAKEQPEMVLTWVYDIFDFLQTDIHAYELLEVKENIPEVMISAVHIVLNKAKTQYRNYSIEVIPGIITLPDKMPLVSFGGFNPICYFDHYQKPIEYGGENIATVTPIFYATQGS